MPIQTLIRSILICLHDQSLSAKYNRHQLAYVITLKVRLSVGHCKRHCLVKWNYQENAFIRNILVLSKKIGIELQTFLNRFLFFLFFSKPHQAVGDVNVLAVLRVACAKPSLSCLLRLSTVIPPHQLVFHRLPCSHAPRMRRGDDISLPFRPENGPVLVAASSSGGGGFVSPPSPSIL